VTKPLTIVMPVFNEAEGLQAALFEVDATLRARGYQLEIIVVDDASTDRTHEIACAVAAQLEDARVLRHPHNLGPCSGLATGGRLAKHERVLLLPADIAVPLEEVDSLWEASMRADIVVGYLRDATQRSPLRRVQSRVYTHFVNRLFGLDLAQVNYVTLYRAAVFRDLALTTKGVARHLEILARARKAGFTLTQVGLGYRPRRHGEATGSRPEVVLSTIWEVLKLRAQLLRARRAGRDTPAR
jgi:glycosyltransferase involved in cell wall biosynthesis